MEKDQFSPAITVIDRGLSFIGQREILSAGEVTDLLLDVRALLVHVPSAVMPEYQPVG